MLTTGCNQHLKIFNANRWILTLASPLQRGLSVSYRRLLVTQQDIEVSTNFHRFDVLQRRFLRSVVGPPRNIDWTLPWHEILLQGNGRIQRFMGQSGCKPWSEICLRHHRNLAHHFALLPDRRWLKRVLH